MFGTNVVKSSLSLSKILSSISKGLGIVNQAIPIYKEVKPMISNAKKIMSIASKSPGKTIDVKPKKETENVVTTSSTSLKNNSNPVFFQ